MNQDQIRIGRIKYWNLYPVYHELAAQLGNGATLLDGHPVQINRWLNEGLVDLAPCSSICLLKSPGNFPAIPYGVAASRAVHSVYWGLAAEHLPIKSYIEGRIDGLREVFLAAMKKHPDNARDAARYVCSMARDFRCDESKAVPVLLSKASETSNALSRIFFYFLFGKKKYLECMKLGASMAGCNSVFDSSMSLLIGDEALEKKSSFYRTVDLAKLWREVTGLPFVFAVWQSRRPLPESILKAVEDSCQKASRKMTVDPGSYLEFLSAQGLRTGTIDLRDYWQRIEYKFDETHIRGLKLFLALAKELLFTQEEYQFLPRMTNFGFTHLAEGVRQRV
jgi:predicted solute-binding protein